MTRSARATGWHPLVWSYRWALARTRVRGRCDYLRRPFVARIPRRWVRTVFELGCKDGADTVRLCEAFGASVHAFECDPEMVARARRRLQGRRDALLVERAVWDANGEISFFPVTRAVEYGREIENPGASSCFRARRDYRMQYEQAEIRVPAVRLEDYCSEAGIGEIDLLCMDLQGAELHALRGLGGMIRNVKLLVTELENREIYYGQDLLPEVHAYMEKHGFRRVAAVRRDDWFGDYMYVRADLL